MTKQSDILTDDQLRQLIQTEINALNNTPATTGVHTATPDVRDDMIDDLTECLKAAISYLEDDSRSERRRQACLDSFRAALRAAEGGE